MVTPRPDRVFRQKRGETRRALLIETCRTLLDERALATLTLADVALRSGVPKSSVYHFFPTIHALLATLAEQVGRELVAFLAARPQRAFADWQAIVTAHIRRGEAFYRTRRHALQLQLGATTPPDIKARDRGNDRSLANQLIGNIAEQFRILDFPDRADVFFRAIEIADLMFALSVIEHDRIVAAYTREAERAAIAYLELYLPKFLPAG